MNDSLRPSRARCLLVWLAVCAVVGTSGLVLAPTVTAPLPRPVAFDDLLTRVAALALLACAAWAWLATSLVVAEAVRTPADRPLSADGSLAVPASVRRLVLAACGVALTGLSLSPAQATPGPVVTDPARQTSLTAGLPYPARPLDSAARAVPALHAAQARAGHQQAALPQADQGATVVVQPGDTLWAIAARRLPAHADAAQITAAWQRLHTANRAVIGPDPDLIRSGQRLRLP